ncbi:MAG TPA: riboflavin synthase [Arachidicoccus sp.]|nr:riboflavin synthase [Arachidicoccus sp.]
MFTGIVETLGTVEQILSDQGNLSFWVRSPLTSELQIDQSLSHDGVCLTVEAIDNELYRVTAIEETLRKTNLGDWETGRRVNIERCMVLNARLDGHIVQGHVDTTATCLQVTPQEGSWLYRFSFPVDFAHLIIEKGSIAVNGTSLTCFDVKEQEFSVAIIPFTYTHTSIGKVTEGSRVNLEFDVIGKYIARMQLVSSLVGHP